MLNEPRGGVFRHINLLVPPKNPKASAAFIIMEPEDTPPMSGSNSICVATVLLDRGLITMEEPVTNFFLEAPGGLVKVKALCKNGKAERIFVQNLPSFVYKLDTSLELEGYGSISADTAFGGDSFVIVDAKKLGFSIDPSEAAELARLGAKITDAATEQIGFRHPIITDWTHYSFCQFSRIEDQSNDCISFKSAVSVKPGKIDRSPTGTALSAKVWELKDARKPYELQTYIIKKAHVYKTGDSNCDLCLTEKTCIALNFKAPEELFVLPQQCRLLNIRTEIMGGCKHKIDCRLIGRKNATNRES